MAKGDYIGEFELVVLLALLHLGSNAYGMQIRREIEARTGRSVSIGAAYATLDRLQGKGYVRSSLGDPTPERGGRRKRFFRIEPAGEVALQRALDLIEQMREGLGQPLGVAP